jgi:hypothetical protein
MMAKPSELTGQVYRNLRAVEMTDQKVRNSVVWKCECVLCGAAIYTPAIDLKAGRRSCKCKHGLTTHGANKNNSNQHPLYRIWRGMLERCRNKNHKDYYNYGGKGIVVHKSWYRYEPFRDYMLSLPNCPSGVQTPGVKLKHSIDRIKSEHDYEPGNVRWATAKQQANNKSNNRTYKVNGIFMTLMEIAEKYGKVSYYTIHDRLTRRGWSLKDAVLTPANQQPRSAK